MKTNHQIVIEIAARHAFLDATCENGFGTLVVSLVICLSKADHLLVFVQVREENGIDDRQSLYLEMEELDENFEEFLDKADKVVYEVYEYDNKYEVKYIKAHPEKFVFDGYYNKIV